MVKSEFTTRLVQAAPAGQGGTFLDQLFDSGLYGHSFNIAATAIADHRVVLPTTKDTMLGPVSFDASYTPAWMQAGVCEYLQKVIFPLGVDAAALMSLWNAGSKLPAQLGTDSPTECHDGSLSAFSANPSPAVCQLVALDPLLADPAHKGTLTRAHPPLAGATPVDCVGLSIDGLPGPPPGIGVLVAAAAAATAQTARAERRRAAASHRPVRARAMTPVLAAVVFRARRPAEVRSSCLPSQRSVCAGVALVPARKDVARVSRCCSCSHSQPAAPTTARAVTVVREGCQAVAARAARARRAVVQAARSAAARVRVQRHPEAKLARVEAVARAVQAAWAEPAARAAAVATPGSCCSTSSARACGMGPRPGTANRGRSS